MKNNNLSISSVDLEFNSVSNDDVFMSQEMIDMSKQKCKMARNPVKLTFDDLKYSVKLKHEEQQPDGTKEYMHPIIKGVSGYALPGQTLFIMGASGAGKTSLLNILSKRISPTASNELSGQQYFNDELEVTDDNFGKLCGYVMQDDILYEHFTVQEAIQFAADLKLAHLDKKER